MKKLVSLITGGFIVALVGLTSVVSSFAGPVLQQATPAVSNIEQVQYQEKRRLHYNDRRSHNRHGWDRSDRRRPHYDNRRDRHGNWNGHRGNRDYRHGHRHYNQGY
jgi:Ni/Co efflux regulator RcnB